MKKKITLSIKVLLCAVSKLKPIFTAEDLAVACWKEYPDDFGLQGYHKTHPDNNKVYLQIMGKDSFLARNGYYKVLGNKKYSITERGKKFANSYSENNLNDNVTKTPSTQAIDRDSESKIKRIVGSIFWSKGVIKKDLDSIAFNEFFNMIGITSSSNRQELKNAEIELKELINIFHKFKQEIIVDKNTKSTMTSQDIKLFEEAKNYCFNEYKEELDYMRDKKKNNS